MIEANPVKYYCAKYFFLVFALILWLAGGLIISNHTVDNKTFLSFMLLFTIGLIFLYLFSVVSDKIRRVAVGKNKIVVLEGDRNSRFEWPEVKSIKFIPFFNLYQLRIRGKKKSIYFFPSDALDPTFVGNVKGKDTSRLGAVIKKRKKKFGID
jgi:hypothetical protein